MPPLQDSILLNTKVQPVKLIQYQIAAVVAFLPVMPSYSNQFKFYCKSMNRTLLKS